MSDLPTNPLGACPLCLAQDRGHLFTGGDRLCGVPGRFSYWTCSACGTVYQDPRIRTDAIPLCYPANYYTHGEVAAVVESGSPRRLARTRDRIRRMVRDAVEEPRLGPAGWAAAIVRRSSTLRAQAYWGLIDELLPWGRRPARALDAGCGAGELLRDLARAGWDAYGLEPDGAAAAGARRLSGRPVAQGDVRRSPFRSESFDLIVLSHSFEHLPHPDEVLRRIGELLTVHGRCVLLYPSAESLGARWLGDAWQGWDPPRHLMLPSRRGLAAAAGRAGLDVDSLRTTTRWPEGGYALSRAWQRGRTEGRPGAWERWAARLSRTAVRLGWPVGEEVIATLRRRQPVGTGSPAG